MFGFQAELQPNVVLNVHCLAVGVSIGQGEEPLVQQCLGVHHDGHESPVALVLAQGDVKGIERKAAKNFGAQQWTGVTAAA